MAKQEDPTLSCLGAIVLMPLMMVAGWFVNGWIGSDMWR